MATLEGCQHEGSAGLAAAPKHTEATTQHSSRGRVCNALMLPQQGPPDEYHAGVHLATVAAWVVLRCWAGSTASYASVHNCTVAPLGPLPANRPRKCLPAESLPATKHSTAQHDGANAGTALCLISNQAAVRNSTCLLLHAVCVCPCTCVHIESACMADSSHQRAGFSSECAHWDNVCQLGTASWCCDHDRCGRCNVQHGTNGVMLRNDQATSSKDA